MSRKLRYACIGAGGIADKKHLQEYSKIPEVELAAICDPDIASAERLSEKYKIPEVFLRYDEMFSKIPLDMVSICTPNCLHAPIAIAALSNGVNVHCEKPLALNAAEARRIVEAKNTSGRKVMVALNNRFTSESVFVRKLAEEGFFGEIYRARCGWRRRNGIPGKGVWFTERRLSGGGALIDLGVHYLDLVLYFMGFPEISSVSGATYSVFGNSDNRLRPGYRSKGDGVFDVEDMAVGFLRTAGNATIDFEFSWASNIEAECKYYELLGTKGGVSFQNGELKIFSEIMGRSIDIKPDLSTGLHMNEFEYFVKCIQNNEECSASPEQAATLMQVIDSVYASSLQKKEVII